MFRLASNVQRTRLTAGVAMQERVFWRVFTDFVQLVEKGIVHGHEGKLSMSSVLKQAQLATTRSTAPFRFRLLFCIPKVAHFNEFF